MKRYFSCIPFCCWPIYPRFPLLVAVTVETSPSEVLSSLPSPASFMPSKSGFQKGEICLAKGKVGQRGRDSWETRQAVHPLSSSHVPSSCLTPVLPSSFVTHCKSSQSFLCFEFANQSACLEPYQMFPRNSCLSLCQPCC